MTDVWTVITRDHHIDFDIELFSSEQRAVDRAREIAIDNARSPEDIQPDQQLTQDAISDGWILDILYSIEDDHVVVIKATLNGE